jgi:glycosyltransferase involved in cell wall biosynthesis
MKYAKKISVIMVAFNSEKFIKYAIDSVIKQTYKNWELLIINDASKDNTENIVRRYYKYKNIKLTNLKKNVGAYKATNLGLRLCKGEYIAILDSDDIADRNRFKCQSKILKNESNVGLVASWFNKIDYKNRIIKKIIIPTTPEFFANTFPCINLICNSSVMFRKKILKEINFFCRDITYSYDYYFFLKIFLKYEIKILSRFFTSYRIHKNQRSNSTSIKKSVYKENLKYLKWSKSHFLINRYNIVLYYKNYLLNYLKLLCYIILENLYIIVNKKIYKN